LHIWRACDVRRGNVRCSLDNLVCARLLAILRGLNKRVPNYGGFSFGPNCAFWFNFQLAVQRGQASYVVAVMAPSDFAQL
jgi:hypothetical protein